MGQDQTDYRSHKYRYIIVDPTENAIVMQSGGQERGHFASLTKILGMIPVLEAVSHNDTKFGNDVTVPRRLDRGDLISRMVPGETYSRRETFARAGASSDVLAILALSHHLAQDSVYGWGGENHAEKEQHTLNYTNKRLKEIGLNDTHVKNVDGRNDVGHYSTPLDIAIAMDYIQKNFPKSAKTAFSSQVRGKHSSIMVRNGEAEWGKTGWLKATKYSQAVYVERDGKPLIAIITGVDRGPETRRSKLAREKTLALLNQAYEIINGPNYDPQSVYEDVAFDPKSPLPNSIISTDMPVPSARLAESNASVNDDQAPLPLSKPTRYECFPASPKLQPAFEAADGLSTDSTNETMFNVTIEKVRAIIRSEEGYSNKAYEDTEGKLTVGIGHLVTDESVFTEQDHAGLPDNNRTLEVGDMVTNACVERLLTEDVNEALNAAILQAHEIGRFNENFVIALASINFQLGVNWTQEWPKAYEHMKAGNFADAMVEMTFNNDGNDLSRWAQQTPARFRGFLEALATEAQAGASQPITEPKHTSKTTP